MKTKLLLPALVFALGLFVSMVPASAAIISPPLLDLDLAAGGTYEGEFSIFFTREDPDTLYLSVHKITVADETGQQQIVASEPFENTLSNWTTLSTYEISKPANITYLNGDNEVKVTYTIDIPFDGPNGGHYAVILVSDRASTTPTGESQIAIGGDVTLQILLNLGDDAFYNTALEHFRVKNNQIFFTGAPVEFESLFANNGNVHVIPRGNIEIFQGNNKIGNISLNPGQRRILPEKSRLYESIWYDEITEASETPVSFWDHVMYQLNNFRFGQFRAELQGFAGKQVPFQSSLTFWVIPVHLFVVIAAFIALIVALIAAANTIARQNRRR